jgi:16S rRNA processing protein RimM
LRRALFKEDFEPIGYLKKTFGIDGHIRFELNENFFEIIDQVDHVFALIDGQHIPFRINEIADEAGLTISFKGLETAEFAQLLCNKEVFLPKDITKGNKIEKMIIGYEFVVGYSLYDKEMLIGEITEVIDSPAHQLAIVNYQGKDKLIPLHESMISYINKENKKIITELPEGLLTL